MLHRLSPEGHQNLIIGLTGKATLLNRWILPIGRVALVKVFFIFLFFIFFYCVYKFLTINY